MLFPLLSSPTTNTLPSSDELKEPIIFDSDLEIRLIIASQPSSRRRLAPVSKRQRRERAAAADTKRGHCSRGETARLRSRQQQRHCHCYTGHNCGVGNG